MKTQIHKTAQYNVQNIIAEKKCLEANTQSVSVKLKTYANFSLSLTQKSGGFIISALDLEHNTKSTLKTF